MRRVLNGFLIHIEKLKSESLIIAATNFSERLDKALFRRFDDLVEFGLPGKQEAWSTIRQLLSSVQTTGLKQPAITSAAKNLSYAEITRACEEAIKEMIIGKKRGITTEMLVRALAERRILGSH
jgi:AAA+ superfamily predicted ATPase